MLRAASFLLQSLVMVLCITTARAGAFADGNAAMHRRDYAAALELLGPLAQDGNAVAEYNLGYLFDQGAGVPQNYAEALKWYKRAAEQGLVEAQYVVSYFYRRGRGLQQNTVKAHMWMNLAASGGLPHAAVELQEQEDQMDRARIAEAQRRAVKWLAGHRRPWVCPKNSCPRPSWLPKADWNSPFYWYGL